MALLQPDVQRIAPESTDPGTGPAPDWIASGTPQPLLSQLEALLTMVGDWEGLVALYKRKVERAYDAVERAELWRRTLPERARAATIDFDALAERYELSGGFIKVAC